MQPLITTLSDTPIVGLRLNMTLSEDRTLELWQRFAPRIKEIHNRVNTDRISLKTFPSSTPNHGFTSSTLFEKWAAVQVLDLSMPIPDGLESMTIPTGQYAVFVHKGPASTFAQTLHYIFRDWMPVSDYEPDTRPHFEIMGQSYRPDDPEAEETIWVPVKPILFTDLQ